MEWIEIQKRKPPQDTYVLVCKWDHRDNVKMYNTQIASRIGDDWFDDKDGDKIDPKYGYVTHLMPLPDEPSREPSAVLQFINS